MSNEQPDVSAFAMRVYAVVRRIPRGRVSTYGQVARAIGCGSARAVGQALRANPFAPQVPCHRVIRGDLTIGGFAGRDAGKEVRRKIRMLEGEGVRFVAGRLAEPDRVFELTGHRGAENAEMR